MSLNNDVDVEFDKQFESRLTQTFLNLEEIDPFVYRSTHLIKPVFGRAVFGGQVVGQALVAASKTVSPDREAHSLHCYFLRPGSIEKPILYNVKQSRDGTTYSNRFIDAKQHGDSMFTMMVSFKKEEKDPFMHQFTMPDVPQPEDLLEMDEILKQRLEMEDLGEKERSYIEHRFGEEDTFLRKPVNPDINTNVYFNKASLPARQCVWIKTRGHIGENQAMHKCAAAYMSDAMLIGTAILPSSRKRFFMASVDHSIWFHHHVQADDWLLYEMESPQCGKGKAYAQGRMWDRNGTLILSVAQEGVIRTSSPKPKL